MRYTSRITIRTCIKTLADLIIEDRRLTIEEAAILCGVSQTLEDVLEHEDARDVQREEPFGAERNPHE